MRCDAVTDDTPEIAQAELSPSVVLKKHQPSKSRKRTGKTLFPNMTAAGRRGPDSDIDDLLHLQKHVTGTCANCTAIICLCCLCASSIELGVVMYWNAMAFKLFFTKYDLLLN